MNEEDKTKAAAFASTGTLLRRRSGDARYCVTRLGDTRYYEVQRADGKATSEFVGSWSADQIVRMFEPAEPEAILAAEVERNRAMRLCAAYENVIAAAREWNAVYIDGEGFEVQEPLLDVLAVQVAELQTWLLAENLRGIPEGFTKALKDAPSVLDVAEDPNGPLSKHLFPEMFKK